MAYVNVAEWSPDQTADWLKGVDKTVAVYASVFLSCQIHGHQLLNFRADDLENLNITTIGHQELILEAVAQLRNFHYELDRENLQYLALKLSCAATSLSRELVHHEDSSKVETQTLSDVAYVIGIVKPLVLWLDRSPFTGRSDYTDKKAELLKLSLNMATMAQRGRFAVRPLQAIKDSCKNLSKIANVIIQEISDPMVLQPASLDLVTLKKRENELGFDILPSFNGIHHVIDIKFGSPAHNSGKIENGDEIVQVNYQTVVGWQPNEILFLCQESPIDVLLTLKKRPRHTHTYGQIYMKPYRLPSKKRTPYNKWGSLPSPRPELLTICNFEMPLPKPSPVLIPPPCLDTEGNSSSDENEMLSPPGSPTTLNHAPSQLRIYMPKPRSVVQRRNTISGSSPILKRPNTSIEQFWRELRDHKSLKHSGSAQITDTSDMDEISDSLCRRDKSVSCSTGLEVSPRPKTCLGVSMTHPKIVKLNPKQLCDNLEIKSIKTVKFQDQLVPDNDGLSENDLLVDKENIEQPTRERGRLDKSYSTPAYDFGENEDAEFPLMKEIIPESPTLSIESPTIVIHSPQKVEQILEFKKSSEQISGAMIQQAKDKNKVITENHGMKTIVENSNDTTSSKYNQLVETINIPLLENKAMLKQDNVFMNDFGEINSKAIFNTNYYGHISGQCEVIEVINEEVVLPSKTDLKIISISEVPPEPPPRPLSTQKPGYIPPKPKNIQKDDIHVIPNVDFSHNTLPQRKDIPINSLKPTENTGLGSETKLSPNNLSTTELSQPRTPLLTSKSLQKLESDNKQQNSSILNFKSNTLEGPKLSLSPPNSMVRGILSSGKPKSLKKKNSILAKRRKVSVKDLGTGEMQGYLYQRCRTKNNSNANWQLRWYILTDNTFYGFKAKEATKAECLIFLSGFTVSVAQEVKSKPFAFKVYHTGTAFYFACEDAESMGIWVENITKATLKNNDSWERASKKDKKTDESKHFSETDYSDEDFNNESNSSIGAYIEKNKTPEKQEKAEKTSKFGSLKKFANRLHKSDSHENVSNASASLDRKFLRFLPSKHKNKEEKTKLKSNDVPVPTDHYRSYRKIPSTSISSSVTADDLSTIASSSQTENNDKISQNVAKIKKIEPIENTVLKEPFSDTSSKQSKKSNPINYIHASNPNLLDFDISNFVTKPKSNAPFLKSLVPRSDNFIGSVTLEQFMLNKQEEERRQMYSDRVLMGVERDMRRDKKVAKHENAARDDNLLMQLNKIVPDVIYGEIPTYMEKNKTPSKIEQIQNRCLPKTPDDKLPKHSLSDCILSDSKYSKGKESSKSESKSFRMKKKNHGYETINYDEMTDVKKNNNIKPTGAIDVENTNDVQVQIKKINENRNNGVADPRLNEKQSSQNKLINSMEPKLMPKSTIDSIKDLGYETIYGEGSEGSDIHRSSVSSGSSNPNIDLKGRKVSNDGRKPTPPPKTAKAKQLMNRQCSLSSSSSGDRKSIEERPVFKQGESPEKFWLDSLRRNDKIYSAKSNEATSFKMEKFYTKHSEPSTFMKSSEATIVKSDKLQNKSLSHGDDIKKSELKPLKSATQYTPMSLPLSSNKSLKTSPKFELALDSRDSPPTVSNMSRFRQMFQHSSHSKNTATQSPTSPTPKEKTLLGSPLLHRAIFRKHHNQSSGDEWTKEFSYSKLSPSSAPADNITKNESYVFTNNDPMLSTSEYETNISNVSTPDYPHLEYPPVFEPETYSLVDPGPSILRKKNYDDNKK